MTNSTTKLPELSHGHYIGIFCLSFLIGLGFGLGLKASGFKPVEIIIEGKSHD